MQGYLQVLCLLAKVLFRGIVGVFTYFIPAKRKSIRDETVLITGGGRGIGKKLAREFAKESPKLIILWGRNGDVLSATAKQVNEEFQVPVEWMTCDLSKPEDIYQKAEELKERYGEVSMLVNNAGIVYGNTILESRPEDMEKTVQVNTLAHFYLLKAFLPSMQQRCHGHIVTINSMLGYFGLNSAADYCTSKYATLGLTESLVQTLRDEGHTGVKVTSIHPFIVNTDMFKGCNTRFPALFPALDQGYVARKTVDAVLTNTESLLMPRMMYLFVWIKSILPVEALTPIQKFTGVDTAMTEFHAHH